MKTKAKTKIVTPIAFLISLTILIWLFQWQGLGVFVALMFFGWGMGLEDITEGKR